MLRTNKIVSFLMEHSIHDDVEQSIDCVDKHTEYNTMLVLEEDDEVIAVARWNITGAVAHILEAVVRPDKRNGDTLRKMIDMGLMLNPDITGVTWDRKRKYPNSKRREYKVRR